MDLEGPASPRLQRGTATAYTSLPHLDRFSRFAGLAGVANRHTRTLTTERATFVTIGCYLRVRDARDAGYNCV